jgi:hypothetical protein
MEVLELAPQSRLRNHRELALAEVGKKADDGGVSGVLEKEKAMEEERLSQAVQPDRVNRSPFHRMRPLRSLSSRDMTVYGSAIK